MEGGLFVKNPAPQVGSKFKAIPFRRTLHPILLTTAILNIIRACNHYRQSWIIAT